LSLNAEIDSKALSLAAEPNPITFGLSSQPIGSVSAATPKASHQNNIKISKNINLN
jgi:hypothetical protein